MCGKQVTLLLPTAGMKRRVVKIPLWVDGNLQSPRMIQVHSQVPCSALCPHVDQLLVQGGGP